MLCCLLLVIAGGLIYKQEISDTFRALTFDPSPRAVEVLDAIELTPGGERLFLASRPTVDGSQHFNAQCAEVDHSEQGHVLGCYVNQRIRLFDVQDERVTGIVEVTAAHELLHAAYARLGERDRQALARELRDVFDELSANDPALAERMAVYEHLSPAAFANELHSVLGTEVRELPESLEAHYAQWFSDRAGLIDRFEAFHSVFAEFSAQAEAIELEMSTLRRDVEARSAEYEAEVKRFNGDAAVFQARNERFEFSDDVDGFERIRSELSERRDWLQAMQEGLQADIEHYNALREQLRELGRLSTDLDQQLDSTLAPPTTRPTEQ